MSTFAQGFGPFSVALVYYYYSVAFDLFSWVMERLDTILLFSSDDYGIQRLWDRPPGLGGILCLGPEKRESADVRPQGIEWIWTSENEGEGRNRMFC